MHRRLAADRAAWRETLYLGSSAGLKDERWATDAKEFESFSHQNSVKFLPEFM